MAGISRVSLDMDVVAEWSVRAIDGFDDANPSSMVSKSARYRSAPPGRFGM